MCVCENSREQHLDSGGKKLWHRSGPSGCTAYATQMHKLKLCNSSCSEFVLVHFLKNPR